MKKYTPAFAFDRYFPFGRKLLLLLLVSIFSINTYAQNTFPQSDTLKKIIQRLEQYRNRTVTEKIYLHLDRPIYLSGETMWFKLYYVDGTFHRPLSFSKVAYVEVLDKDQTPVLQTKIDLNQSHGAGSLVVPYSLPSGNYLVRAYTGYMKNFSPEIYFQKTITIVNTTAETIGNAEKLVAEYQVDFFPEGGHLVVGLESKVAFKITDASGKGQNFNGIVVDPAGKEVAQLKPAKFGMGQFVFTPTAHAMNYRAVITLPNKKTLTKNIPPAQTQGWVMRLQDNNAEHLTLTVNSTNLAAEPVYLLGHARQLISVAALGNFQQGQATFLIDKMKLPNGISHFTLFNQQKKPVCERLYFKPPGLNARIQATSTKNTYATREKVTIEVETRNQQTQPAPFNMSVAVYQSDSLQAAGILDIGAYFWLTSDVKGYIESPDFYLNNTAPEVATATDNLMLTQGWSRFSWQKVFEKEGRPLAYLPELNGPLISGKVTSRATKNPVGGVPVYLAAPGHPLRVYTATSNQQGFIQFESSQFYGPKEIIVQNNTVLDSSYQLEVFSPFSERSGTFRLPLFSLSETFKNALTHRHVQTQVQQGFPQTNPKKYIYPVIDSLAFYGKPDESYLLDAYQRFQVMEEVLREYVPGVVVRKRRNKFHFQVLNTPYKSIFQNDPLVLLDGVPVFDIDKIMAFDPLKIKKLEVITRRYVLGPQEYDGLVSFSTYKGDLGGFELNTKALMTEYEGMQLQREFYSPQYETPQQKASRLPDFRNLLYWSPNLTTDTQGKGAIDFYTSDQAGDYLLVIQGLSEKGEPSSTVYRFKVRKGI